MSHIKQYSWIVRVERKQKERILRDSNGNPMQEMKKVEEKLDFIGDVDFDCYISAEGAVEHATLRLYTHKPYNWMTKAVNDVPNVDEKYDVKVFLKIHGGIQNHKANQSENQKKGLIYSGRVHEVSPAERIGSNWVTTIRILGFPDLMNIMASREFNEDTPLIEILKEFAATNNLTLKKIEDSALLLALQKAKIQSFTGNGIQQIKDMLRQNGYGLLIQGKEIKPFSLKKKFSTKVATTLSSQIIKIKFSGARPVVQYEYDATTQFILGDYINLISYSSPSLNGLYIVVGKNLNLNLRWQDEIKINASVELFKLYN